MVRLFIALISILVFFSERGESYPLIADLSLSSIDVNSDFNGQDVVIFGAVDKLEDLIIVVRGFKENVLLGKRGSAYGLWINKDLINLKDIDSFYTVASTKPLSKFTNRYIFKKLEIGIYNLDIDTGYLMRSSDNEDDFEINGFVNAFVDLRSRDGLYSTESSKIGIIGNHLFRWVVHFPKNVKIGKYVVEVYSLDADGYIRGIQMLPFTVNGAGIEADIKDLSSEKPAVYGALAVIIALIVGWTGNVFLRRKS